MAGRKLQRNIAILLFLVGSLSVMALLRKGDQHHANTRQLTQQKKRKSQTEYKLLQDRLPTRAEMVHKRQSQKNKVISLRNSLTIKEQSPAQIPFPGKAQYLDKDETTMAVSNNTGCDWLRQQAPKPPYFLTAVLLVRIYKSDKANLTSREMMQWLGYLRYAGVEHVYVYDAWVHGGETQEPVLGALISKGFVTYIDWHKHNPYTISGTQVAAYQHCISNYGTETVWQTAIDIDEYPFVPLDTNPGFFHRYVEGIKKSYGENITEVTMKNFLYLGKPSEKEFLIERLKRRTPRPSNRLVKPVYKPKYVRAQVHHNSLKKGKSMNAPSEELRMNHYWGARLQDWGEDTPEILGMTIPDDSIQPIVRALKECKNFFM